MTIHKRCHNNFLNFQTPPQLILSLYRGGGACSKLGAQITNESLKLVILHSKEFIELFIKWVTFSSNLTKTFKAFFRKKTQTTIENVACECPLIFLCLSTCCKFIFQLPEIKRKVMK